MPLANPYNERNCWSKCTEQNKQGVDSEQKFMVRICYNKEDKISSNLQTLGFNLFQVIT